MHQAPSTKSFSLMERCSIRLTSNKNKSQRSKQVTKKQQKKSNTIMKTDEETVSSSEFSVSSSHSLNKATVSFSSRVVVRHTIHLSDYTPEEIENTFFTKDEYRRIKEDIKFTLELMEADLLDEDSTEFCRRGIEHKTSQGLARRWSTRTESVLAVLAEQDKLWDQKDEIRRPTLNDRWQSRRSITTTTVPVSCPTEQRQIPSAEEAIAAIYSKETSESARMASVSGFLDERAALDDGRKKNRRKSPSSLSLLKDSTSQPRHLIAITTA